MVSPERTPLSGDIEVDDTYVGGRDSDRRGGRDAYGSNSIVLVAVEVRGSRSGRVRMEVSSDLSADSLGGFVQANVAPGATVRTDGWQGFKRLAHLGYEHLPTSQRAARLQGVQLGVPLPFAHRAISNLKTWLRGTYRGVSETQLQVYLDEYVFQFNRRRTPMAAFQTLLGIGAQLPPTTWAEIKDPTLGLAELTG